MQRLKPLQYSQWLGLRKGKQVVTEEKEKVNKICQFCAHWEYRPIYNDFRCFYGEMRHNGMIDVQRGAGCIHDPFLDNLFEPSEDQKGSINQISQYVKRIESKMTILELENSELKTRLTKINA